MSLIFAGRHVIWICHSRRSLVGNDLFHPQVGRETGESVRRDGMLPQTLLRAAQGHPVLVELKSGETFNGHLVLCDT